MDLHIFDFDYDLTWAGFFLNADEKIYGRFGGRDASSAEKLLSLAGLHYAMKAALATHENAREAGGSPSSKEKPLRAEEYPAAKQLKAGQCIHCHQVNEFKRDLLISSGAWSRDMVWIYPLPENVGINLEVDQGDRIRAVTKNSSADRLGLQAGDKLELVNELPVAAFADVQYALHRAPASGKIALSWRRGDKEMTGQLELASGWRKTNLTWRPSLLDLLPSLPLSGENLSAQEKKALDLPEKRLAFRQDKFVHSSLRNAGVKPGDVIVGMDGQPLDMTMRDFLAHVRRDFLVGDRIVLDLLRDGKKVEVPVTLR